MISEKLRGKLPQIVDIAIDYAGKRDFVLSGAREAALELASQQSSEEALVDAIASAIDDHRIVWRGDDPHDGWGP